MIIYEIAVLGNTHLFKRYLDVCTGLDEPRQDINIGHLELSPLHKINFYFLNEYNPEKKEEYELIIPYLLGYIGIFDWQDEGSFIYLKELLDQFKVTGRFPLMFHAVNLKKRMPFTKNRIEKGLMLEDMSFLFLDNDPGTKNISRAIEKFSSLVSSQEKKKNAKAN